MDFSGWTNQIDRSLALIFRSPCGLCARPTLQVFCQDCSQRLQGCRRNSAWVTGINHSPLYGWGHYEGSLKQSLAKLKYERQSSVAEPLGQWLAQLWFDHIHLDGKFQVVPIPLHKDREHQRGYNQAELIARSFCQVTGFPLRSHGLRRTQSTTAQYSLSRTERYQNLQDAFTIGPALKPQNQKYQNQKQQIIVIDDIFTTGATLKAATGCLQQSGLTVSALLTVAVSERQQR
jgi:ComF family protein